MGTAGAEGFGLALRGVDVDCFVENDVGDENSSGRKDVERTVD